MKMSKVLLSLLSASFILSVQAADEFDYIPTPLADQIADLNDNDSDGVINARDKCESTPIGSEIDNDGCEKVIDTSNQFQLKILFENDSAVVSPAFVAQITDMAYFLADYPETSLELQGYASKVGQREYNLALSEKRALAVKQELLDAGVSNDRIKVVGFGDTVLADKGDTPLSHAQNRRVTATVVGYTSKILEEWNIFTRMNQ